jgi:dGTPase
MSFVIGGLIEGTTAAVEAAGVQTVDDIRSFPKRLAQLTPEARQVNEQLRDFLVERLYAHPDLVRHRNAAVQKLGRLFTYLLDHPEGVSPGYRENLKDEPHQRVVCDYLAGMTDAYFYKVYADLLGD